MVILSVELVVAFLPEALQFTPGGGLDPVIMVRKLLKPVPIRPSEFSLECNTLELKELLSAWSEFLKPELRLEEALDFMTLLFKGSDQFSPGVVELVESKL